MTRLEAEDAVSFRSEIAPILLDHCVACHSARKAEGGYRIDAYAELSKAGDSGIDPLSEVDGEPRELLRRLTTSDQSERMPAESDPLTTEQITLITSWLDSGAGFDGDDATELLPFVIPPPQHPAPPEKYPAATEVAALTFSPDGSKILSGGYHELLVWDLEGKLLRRISNVGQRTFAIVFAVDGKRVAVAGGQPGKSGEVRIIDFESGQVSAVLGRSTDVIWDVAFRPHHNEIAVAAADKSIRIVNLETLEETRTLLSHADWVTDLDWTLDGKHLVSASRDKSAKVFDAETGQLLVSYKNHNAAVRSVSLSSDGTQAFSVGGDHQLHRWNVLDGKKLATIALGGEGFQVLGSDDWAWVACADKRLLKIDLAKNNVLSEFKGYTDWVLSVAIAPDQSRIATGSYDGEIRVWDTADGGLLKQWPAHP